MRTCTLAVALSIICASARLDAEENAKTFRAGAFAIDVTPETLPVLVNGGMYSRTADKVVDRLHARCLVLDDGRGQIAIVVVDSCMMPRDLLDEAKQLASQTTGIPTKCMLISATHTHSAPAAMGALGTDVDEAYARFLPARIARGIQLAQQNLEPARIGWASAREPRNVYCRRYLMKEGTARTNPFSGKTDDRAQMNPGHNNPNKIKRTGPVDDEVSVLSVQSKDGRPIALLANYSTHYAGAPALSADYFGVFAQKIERLILPAVAKAGEGGEKAPPFVGIMSNGTSGDANCYDFTRGSRRKFDRFTVAEDTARAAHEAFQKIKYYDWVPIVMEEALLTLKVRMPGEDEIARARHLLQSDEGKKLRSIPAVYAREAVLLRQMPPTRELKLQAIRIGPLGITAIPNEVYGITGLTIKKQSPLAATFNIELANGAEGYIPPPDQHKLGGYTTWRARTSCLEEGAEPKIRAKILELLNKVAAQRQDERPVAASEKGTSGERQLPESARDRKSNEESTTNDVPDGAASRSPETPPKEPRKVPSPLSPVDSLNYLHVRPGMKVELAAAEPLVRDPVAFDWGPDGKLWVVEYLDYPTGIDGKGTGGGRVVFLEDTNDDGRYNKSTVFIDGLNFPTGIMAWRGGVLITAAPDILYAEDNDGDGKADVAKPLYTGFYEGNQQLRVNGLRWGLDNWIYCASGAHRGGYGEDSRIKSTKTGELVHVGSRDFRIRPDEGLIDPQSGPSQFGRNRDAWGNWFGCQNAKPMWHFVLAEHYLRRNPHVAYPDSKMLISDVPGQRPVFPKSRPGKFYHASQAGRFTSANSAMIYRDELLGEEFIGNSFVSEPVHNLVHREIVERNGVTFQSHKPKDEVQTEFLASEDTWFRPTTIRTGPDGALWVADMYREIIEHPRWVKDELKPIVDTRRGNDRGRIYRIYPEGARPRAVPRLDRLEAKELVAILESPSATLRDMAHIQIVTRKLDAAVEPLEKLVRSGKRPETRLQALCVLHGLDALTASSLGTGLVDVNPWVVREALRLCESAKGLNSAVGMDAEDPAVHLQLACLLGFVHTDRAAQRLADIALAHGDDPFTLAAAMSSLNDENLLPFAARLFDSDLFPSNAPSSALTAGTIATAVGLEQPEVVKLIAVACTQNPDVELGQLVTLQRALSRHNLKWKQFDDKNGTIRARVERALDVARSGAANADILTDPAWLADALKLIGTSPEPSDADLRLIASHLIPQSPARIQQAAVAALGAADKPNVPELLLVDWKSHGPQLRSEILDLLLSRGNWTLQLLAAIEKGNVAVADIDASRRQRLLTSKNTAIRTRARELLAAGTSANRVKVVAQYKPVLASLPSRNSARGKEIFVKRCSACHRVDNQGNQVGPDLAGLTDKSPDNFLVSILDPNRAVEPKYLSYTAVTDEGRIFQGMLADESGGSLTLLDAEGKQHVLLRRNLEQLQASGKSLMPEGMEKDIPPEGMADLLAYLQQALRATP